MRTLISTTARVIGVTGLAAASALHLAWATGSSWPAQNEQRLAEAVIGSGTRMPGTVPTLVVAAGTGGVSLLAAGALGLGRLQRLGVRAMSTGLLARGILGGDVALSALRLPPSGARFRRLDSRYYRPATVLIGLCLHITARSQARTDASRVTRRRSGHFLGCRGDLRCQVRPDGPPT